MRAPLALAHSHARFPSTAPLSSVLPPALAVWNHLEPDASGLGRQRGKDEASSPSL